MPGLFHELGCSIVQREDSWVLAREGARDKALKQARHDDDLQVRWAQA